MACVPMWCSESSRRIGRGTGRVLCFVGLFALSCGYDLDVSLDNMVPEMVGEHAVADTLVYPDSILCTLTVRDLNDTEHAFSLRALDSTASAKWPWWCVALDQGLGDIRSVVQFPGTTMGAFRGMLSVCDAAAECDSLTLSVCRLYQEPFDALPLDPGYWRVYSQQTESHLSMDWAARRIRYLFEVPATADSVAAASAGVMSTFRLAGDCRVSVDFGLRDDMYSGFEVSFFASTKADTGRFPGRYFGVFLEGQDSWVDVKCKSVSYQTAVEAINFFSGTILLSRTDSTVSFECTTAEAGARLPSLPDFTFPAKDSLYLHMRMRVSDQRRMRHCTWDNLRVERGELLSP